MSAYTYHEIACDGLDCFKAYNDQGSATQVRQRAKQSGWQVSQPGGKDFCPAHRSAGSVLRHLPVAHLSTDRPDQPEG